MISIEELMRLPLFYRATITPDHLDEMGHLNVRWYVAFYDEAAWRLFEAIGFTQDYFKREQGGLFALQQFIRYLAEVRLGEMITVRSRILGRSAKRIHFMHFMVNETRPGLASTMEMLTSHADLTIRRTSPFPPHIETAIEALLTEHQQLDWSAPVCGVIQP